MNNKSLLELKSNQKKISSEIKNRIYKKLNSELKKIRKEYGDIPKNIEVSIVGTQILNEEIEKHYLFDVKVEL